MVLCSPQVDSSSALAGTSVTEIPFRNILGLNQQTYERLKVALSLNLRRQIFIAVCDDLPLRDRLAMQLQAELTHVPATPPAAHFNAAEPRAIPNLVTLELNLHDPNPLAQMAEWLSHFPRARLGRTAITPSFQVLGIERLTRQSAATQSVFLAYLQNIEQQLPLIESCLLLWMTQPWFRMLPEAVPEFWRCRTGIFEFIGDPTPLLASSPERIQISSSSLSLPSGSRDLSSLPQFLDDPDRSVDAAATLNSSENPWLPLADDLNQWYEPDPDSGDSTSCAAALTDHLDLIDFLPQSLPSVTNQEQGNLSNLEQWAVSLSQTTQTPDSPQLEQFALSLLTQLTNQPPPDAPAPMQDGAITETVSLNPNQQVQEGDIEQALPLLQHIELLQQQIELLHQGQESPQALATAYRTLGNFYRDCIEQGDASAQNLTVAIQAYEQALQWLPEKGLEQAETLNDLGNLYWMVAQLQLTAEEAVVCLQQTVQVYQLAIENLDPHQTHFQAMVQNNLGAAYADLARYQDPALNLQRSINAYQQALQHRTATSDSLHYASTQNNLGTTYWNLAQYQQPEANLKQAIAAYSEAIRYYDPAQDPLNYAMIQNNVGTAYWNLAQYEQSQEYLTLALTAYHVALQYRTLETAPTAFAATQNNLGTAYWHLASYSQPVQERLAYLQQAISAYEMALQAVDDLNNHQPESAVLNFDLAATQNNLGLAHFQIATDLHANLEATLQAAHLEAALKHHVLALQGWEAKPELRQTALNCIVQTIRACYQQLGLNGQNHALSQVPSLFLSEVLSKL